MAHLRAGSLNRRLSVLRRRKGAVNAFNAPRDEWPVAFDLYASRKDLSDMEKVRAGAQASAVIARFVIRASELSRSITTVDRLVCDGIEWNILGLKEADLGARGRTGIEIRAEARS